MSSGNPPFINVIVRAEADAPGPALALVQHTMRGLIAGRSIFIRRAPSVERWSDFETQREGYRAVARFVLGEPERKAAIRRRSGRARDSLIALAEIPAQTT